MHTYPNMKTNYSLILLLFVKICFAQNEVETIYKNQIKLSPVRLITTIRGIQLSYERQISGKLSTQLTASYIVDLLPYHFADFTKMTGYSLGIEQKYFLGKTKIKRRYLSADFTFLDSNFDMVHSFAYIPSGDSLRTFYSDTISVSRKTSTLSIKYGVQYCLKHFVFEINAGIGIRYRDVTHTNKLHQDAVWERSREPNALDELFSDGHYFTLNIPLGLKIGYRF